MLPIVGIAGWSGSGKTTLIEKLVAHFSGAGLTVATVKHTHHRFDIDTPDSDSTRHRKAGAAKTAIVSSQRVAIIEDVARPGEPSLDDVIARLGPADLVLVEGYKSAAIPKIECRRQGVDGKPLAPHDPLVFAVASDHSSDGDSIPNVSLNDVAAIASLIEGAIGPFAPKAARA